jgi:hypothetical protein
MPLRLLAGLPGMRCLGVSGGGGSGAAAGRGWLRTADLGGEPGPFPGGLSLTWRAVPARPPGHSAMPYMPDVPDRKALTALRGCAESPGGKVLTAASPQAFPTNPSSAEAREA